MIDNVIKLTYINLLHAKNCSCIIVHKKRTYAFHRRGVADLYQLFVEKADILAGSFIADKVVGKGAAALIIVSGIAEVYADILSQGAFDLLTKHKIPFTYGVLVSQIINRNQTGSCPLELLCNEASTAEECLPLINNFIEKRKNA